MSRLNASLRISEPAPNLDTGRAETRSIAMSPTTEHTGFVSERTVVPTVLEAARCAGVAAVETDKAPPAISRGTGPLAYLPENRAHPPGTPTARIYRHGRSPMQSGRAREAIWLLTFEPQYRTKIDFLMGWTSSRDTLQQVELRFSALEEAVAFAKRRGLQYAVMTPLERKVRRKSYADNFRHDRLLPWTH